ncbi:MAG TPA: HlyD family secretion protein, partial [Candidatus Saccharimonadales bacterium]|nr:HlyD family secretion protein [Candidatus Saccharimonadales bacterium]
PPEAAAETARRPGAGRWVAMALLGIAALAGAGYGLRTIQFYAHHAETDNAQIEGHISPVLPRVSGFVTEVAVEDNQPVRPGQLLVRIDDRDLRSRLALADAAELNARAALEVARANVQVALTARTKALADLNRYAPLRRKGELSQQQFDAAQSAADAAVAQHEAALRQVAAAAAGVGQKKADLDYARLQLSYATLTAPAAGVVSRKSVEAGQLVQAGQPLMAVVQGPEVWVVANFKETQLRKMQVGQSATIDVDTYPGREFHGRVESIAAATGARFSLLPPDNATGNFTKVVQRIPVKITLTDPPDPARPLRVGMSVRVVVHLD